MQTVSLQIEMAMDVTSMQITQAGAETMIQLSSTQCRCAALVAVATVKVKMKMLTTRLTACACVMPQILTVGEIASSASMTFSMSLNQ